MSASAAARLTRLLALVPWLVSHEGVTMQECAEHFGVTQDELQEDLWQVIVCGLPGYGPGQLVDIQFWDEDDEVRGDGVIRVVDPQTLGRPLRLTHAEALALLVSLRTLAQLPGVVDRDAIITAAAKLEAATSGEVRDIRVDVDVPADVRAAVDTALAGRRELEITYASATRDEVTRRRIQPVRLHAIDGLVYLEAYCLLADARRTFRLDRVVNAEVGRPIDGATEPSRDEGADRPAAPAPATAWAVVDLAPTARWVMDVHGAAAAPPEDGAAPEGWTRVRLPLHSLDWATRLVLSLRGGAAPVNPPELASAVALAAAAALAAYP